MADRFSQNSSRRRYDSEEDRIIQNQLNDFDKKYRQELDVDELLKNMPVIKGGTPENPAERSDEMDHESRRVEEIDLDNLELDADEYDRGSKARRGGDLAFGSQASRKNTVMNNPLAALIMSLNIDENEGPIEPPKEEEEETEDIDKLIELSHNRDRGVRGQSSTGGGMQAINELLDGYISPTGKNPMQLDAKESHGFWEEVLTVKSETPEQQKMAVEGLFDRKSLAPPAGIPKEETKAAINLVSSIIGVVGKPLAFVKNKITGSKEIHPETQTEEPKVLKTLNIDDLISQQQQESQENEILDDVESDSSTSKQVAPVIEILPKFSRVLTFDDAWVTNTKNFLKENEREYEKIKINREKVTTEASNKLLGISDPSDLIGIGGESGHSKVTTSSVLKLDKVTSDPTITNSLSQHLGSKEPTMTVRVTPYKLLLEAFADQEKIHLKECKKRREAITAHKQQSQTSSIFYLPKFPELSERFVVVDEPSTKPIAALFKSCTKSPATHMSVSQDRTLVLVATQDAEIIEIDAKKLKTHKDKYNGGVSSLDISPNNNYWASGMASGEVLVKKSYGGWAQKRCKVDDTGPNQTGSFSGTNKKSVKHVIVRFTSNDVVMAATDTHIWKIGVKDLKVVLDVTKIQVWRCSMDDLEICEIRPLFQENSCVLAVSTLPGTVRIFSCGDKFTEVAKVTKPEEAESDAITSVGIVDIRDVAFTLIVIFWDTCVLLVSYEGISSNTLKIVQAPKGRRILEGFVLKGYLICMLLDDYSIEVGTIQSLFALTLKSVQDPSSGEKINLLTAVSTLQPVVNPWVGLKNVLNLNQTLFAKAKEVGFKNDGSKMLSFKEICKPSQNCLYLLGSDGPIIVKLLTPKEVSMVYAEKTMWISAFKYCVFLVTQICKAPPPEQITAKLTLAELSMHFSSTRPSNIFNEQEEEWRESSLIDKSAKTEHLISRICVDALMHSENSDFLLNQFREKTDEIVLWQMLDLHIQAGHIDKVPIEAYPAALKYLAADSVEYLIYNTSKQALQGHMDKLRDIMKTLWYRKLWTCVYRLGLLVYEDTLYSICNTLLSDCQESLLRDGESQISKYVDAALSFDKDMLPHIWTEDRPVEDYLRLVWFLRVLCSWDVSNIIEDTSRVEITLNYVIAWMVLPQNLKGLSSLQMNVYLEILLDLFSNVDFSSNMKAFELVRRNVEPFKTKLLPLMGAPGAKPVINIPEGSEAIKFKMFLIFKILEEILFEHCQITRRVEISFFGIELILLSVFGRHPYQDIQFIQSLLVNLLSDPFTPGRLWHRFVLVSKEEFEEKVTKFISRLQEHNAFESCKETLLWLAKQNKHLRVLGYLLEATSGPVEALPVYIELSQENPGTSNTLFGWMKKKLFEMNDKPAQKLEMAKQIFKNIDTIIAKNKQIAKEIIIQMPNLGNDAVSALKLYPDLQLLYLESLLLAEQKISRGNQLEPLSAHLKTTYIKLLCRYKPDMVLAKLISYNMPRDGTLGILEEYDIKDAALYIRYQLGYTDQSIKDSEQLIMKSFQEYLESPSEDNLSLQKILSLGYFGYEMYCKIAEEMHAEDHPRKSHTDEESEESKKLSEGTRLLIDLLKKLIAYYVSLIRNHTYSPRDKQVRVHFLKDYIFHCMVEDLLVRGAAGTGCSEVVSMVREGELQDVRLTEIANLIKLSQITRLQMQSTREVIEEAAFAQESDYLRKAVSILAYNRPWDAYTATPALCARKDKLIYLCYLPFRARTSTIGSVCTRS